MSPTRSLTVLMLAAVVGCSSEPTPGAESPTVINYEDVGEGAAVVLVHGFTQTHKSWRFVPIFESLMADHRLVSVDLRGHGDSPKPHDPRRYGREMAEDLARVLDELGIDRAHFIGFSMGASVVGDLLVTHPERVQTAALGSGFFTLWDEREEEFAESVLKRGETGERFPWEPPNQDFEALAAAIRGARFAEVSDREIAAITTPTLVCFGSLELDVMTSAQRRRLASLPASMRFLTIDGADHDSEKAAVLRPEFTAAVRRLINDHPM